MQVQVARSPSIIAADPIDAMSIWRVAMNPMIYRLSVTHRKLEDEIRRELRKRMPDSLRLLRLKKLKLVIKDRVHRHFSGRRTVPA
jgi:uncharacterized protein